MLARIRRAMRPSGRLADFEIAVEFLTPEQGGRKALPNQGYRPDLGFEDSPATYMIHPTFLREDGVPYEPGSTVASRVRADMYVLFPETQFVLRDLVHVGQKVRIVEGNRTVATGEVTRLKNLPNALTDVARLALAFCVEARPFASWLEDAAAGQIGTIDLRNAHEFLGRLQVAASTLPAIAPSDEAAPSFQEIRLLAALRSKLPFDYYRAIFDPLYTSDAEPVRPSLADDLNDIYTDVREGIMQYDRGDYAGAIWQWRFTYYTHWGRHLALAQFAIWQYLQRE